MYSHQALKSFWANCFRYSLVFVLLSNHLILTAWSAYDPNHKHFKENFDPAEADPKRNVSCVGDSYDIQLPMLEDFNPNGLSMQRLCVKPQYGGGGQNQHAGAYCYNPIAPEDKSESESNAEPSDWSDDDSNGQELVPVMMGKIVFDTHRGVQASRQLQNPRFMQACIYRCFCNYGVADVSIQPESDHFWIQKWRASEGYELQIDVNNDFTVPMAIKMGELARGNVDSTRIVKKPQIDSMGSAYLPHSTYMNLDPGNEIQCTGDIPNFVFPSPYTRSDFSSIQELCAIALSGGNKDANAGGYCHRSAGSSSSSSSSSGTESTVWFSDSMTPRYSWTWGGGSFFFTASIRFHCWRNCACKSNPPQDPDTSNLWRFITGLQLRLHDDGSVNLERGGTPQQPGQGTSTGTQVLPPQQQGAPNSPSGKCGASGAEFCPKAWDTTAWGIIPREPPNATDLVKPSPPKDGAMGVCGNECRGPSDCGTTENQYSCSCAFPSANDAHLLSLDPVMPIAICIALFASTLKKNTKSLGGRDFHGYVDERGVPYSCRCNETVVLDACCDSRDGMVWVS